MLSKHDKTFPYLIRKTNIHFSLLFYKNRKFPDSILAIILLNLFYKIFPETGYRILYQINNCNYALSKQNFCTFAPEKRKRTSLISLLEARNRTTEA